MQPPEIPNGLVEERCTPLFDVDSVPAALTGSHHTAVWAELRVEAGTVRFLETHGSHRRDQVVSSGGRLVIVPEVKHRIELSPDARFYVQFFAHSPRSRS